MGLELFYTAFLDLNSCRGLGYGEEGSIPWTAMAEYCVHKGIDQETAEDLFYLVRMIDNEYLKYKRDRVKREMQKNDTKGKMQRGKP